MTSVVRGTAGRAEGTCRLRHCARGLSGCGDHEREGRERGSGTKDPWMCGWEVLCREGLQVSSGIREESKVWVWREADLRPLVAVCDNCRHTDGPVLSVAVKLWEEMN